MLFYFFFFLFKILTNTFFETICKIKYYLKHGCINRTINPHPMPQHPNIKSVYQSDPSRDKMVTPIGNLLIITIIITKPTITYQA